MPLNGVPASFPNYEYPTAGILRNPPEKPSGWAGTNISFQTMYPESYHSWQRLGAENYSFTDTVDPHALAMQMGKIAHCAAVAEHGVDAFEHFVAPALICADPKSALPAFVGGSNAPHEPREVLHEIEHWIEKRTDAFLVTQRLLMVRVRLFAQVTGPSTLVIVGRMRSRAQAG